MRRRRPQDPEGSKARAFRRWLQRNPEHRDRALQRRLESQYQSSEDVGTLAVGLLIFAIVGMGVWRVFTGTWFP